MDDEEKQVMRGVLLWVAGLAALAGIALGCEVAHAQAAPANFLFNGGGGVIASGSSLAAQRAIVGSGITWSAGATGTVATATSAANGALMNVGGTSVRLTGTALARVAANDLASAVVTGIRGGVPGILTAVAITAALTLAEEYWLPGEHGGFQQKQPSIQGAGYRTSRGIWYATPDEACQGFYEYWAGQTGNLRAFSGYTLSPGLCQVPTMYDSGTQYARAGPTQESGIEYSPNAGPAAPQPDKVIGDDAAQQNLANKLTAQNSPAIAQWLTDHGLSINGQALPNINLNPASGPTTTTPTVPATDPATQTQTHTDLIPTCVNNACAVKVSTTSVQLKPDGSVDPTKTPTVTTTDPTPDTGSPQDDKLKVCGLDKGTSCYINEEGTPTPRTQADIDAEAKTYTDSIGQLTEFGGPGGTGGFRAPPSASKVFDWGLSVPTAACVNPTMPDAFGHDGATFNVCDKYEFFQNFIAVICAVLCIIGCVGEVRAAIRGT